MSQWILPTLSEILAQTEMNSVGASSGLSTQPSLKIEASWCGAIAALGLLLEREIHSLDSKEVLPLKDSKTSLAQVKGVILSGTLPILNASQFGEHFASLLFTPSSLPGNGSTTPFQLPPASQGECLPLSSSAATLALLPNDPLNQEQFCLVLTHHFSVAIAKTDGTQGEPLFLFSFNPDAVHQVWQALRSRVLLTGSQEQLTLLDAYYQQFTPIAPDYQIVMRFSQDLLHYLPELQEKVEKPGRVREVEEPVTPKSNSDVELLQAIAHEVKTPLTTIRTLTRLLLKRSDLPPEVLKRLQSIDRECTEQIDRFGLIFRAVELETTEPKQRHVHLTATSLSQVLQQSIPRWQKQASRRNVTLDVVLPQKMPVIVSDPTMLDQVLTGAIEHYTSCLPTGSRIQVEVMLAGDRLKLQFQSQQQPNTVTLSADKPILKSLGQLLMFQPETGILSLNFSVTKNLFQAIGGKLIVRQRPQQGETLTIFLPLS